MVSDTITMGSLSERLSMALYVYIALLSSALLSALLFRPLCFPVSSLALL
jgi:hypothetical protein